LQGYPLLCSIKRTPREVSTRQYLYPAGWLAHEISAANALNAPADKANPRKNAAPRIIFSPWFSD
jgi:hypothetical protein